MVFSLLARGGARALAFARGRSGSLSLTTKFAAAGLTGIAAGLVATAVHQRLSQPGAASGADPGNSYKFPNDLEMHGNYMSMRAFQSGFMNSSAVANLAGISGINSLFSAFGGSGISIGAITSQRGVVSLPLPANLSNDLDPTYSEASLKDEVMKLIPGASGAIAKYVGAAGAAASVASAAYAKTINPMNVVLFTGMPFRQYSYTWKLSPRNKAESDSIRNIVRYLQWCSVPAYFLGGLLLDYPHYFQISIFKDNYLQKFQPAVIERINVNYHGQGAFYKRGDLNQSEPAPAEVELQINFKEVVIVTKDWLNSSGQGPG